MIIINTVNSTRFSLNGIEYFKNYISEVAGSGITIYNAYDRKDVKVDFINYAEIELNGTVYGNVGDLQSALLPVIYTRASLGDGSGFNLTVYETGETPIENIDEIEFDGATVTDDGGGKITVTITGDGGTPTLKQVLDNNHDLVDGNNFQGTGAGDGNTGTEVNAFGTDAGTDNTGNNQNAFGNSAGYENQGENQNALGESAGQENTGNNQNAFGGSAGYQNIGDYQNAFGVGAGFLNTGANQNALGSSAGAYNTGDNQNAFGSSAGVDNTATNQNALGSSAGKNNSGKSQNAFGKNAGQDNTGDNVNAFGENAGDGNSFNNVNLFGVGAQADEDGQTVFSKDSGIFARFSTADLTETRKYTLPDADGTLALLDDIPPAITIDANPTDGSSNAVSSNGVFDALATKVSKSDYTPSHSILVQQSGTGSPTALQVGNNTLVGRVSGGGSDIDDLSTSQVRTMLSINNVDNTSDANKPVSTATQTALDLKQNTLVSGTNIKTINGNSVLGSGNLVISGGGGITAEEAIGYSLIFG
jgi:hypothetical protein